MELNVANLFPIFSKDLRGTTKPPTRKRSDVGRNQENQNDKYESATLHAPKKMVDDKVIDGCRHICVTLILFFLQSLVKP